MYSIHNRDDLEKLKKLQETKSLLHKVRLKEKLGKQDFHYDMEEVFEPVTTKQVESNEMQLQAIDKQTQGVTQAIENQTRAIERNDNTLQNSIKEGIKQYNEITNHNAELRNQLLTSLVNSNQVDSSIVKTVSNLLNDKNKSQFSLEPIEGYPRSSANLFTINPHNPQQVLIKGSTMTFENGNSYDLNHPDLQYFITNTQFDKPINNWGPIYNFLNDMKYDLNYGDKKSTRYQFIKELYSRYQLQAHDLQGYVQEPSRVASRVASQEPPEDYTQGSSHGYPQSSVENTQGNQLGSQSGSQLGSGLFGSYARSSTQQYIFLPSDPDELVDQLKLLYFEKVGRNDSFLINEQIIAIIDKLLEYECISPSQHQNIRSSTQSNLITACNV